MTLTRDEATVAPVPPPAPPKRRPVSAYIAAVLAAVVIVLGLLFPAIADDPYLVSVFIKGLELGLAGLAVAVLYHQLGLVSFGIGAYYGLSAYTFSVLVTRFEWSPGAAAFVALTGTMAVAALVGAVIVRLNALPFVMVTLAIGQAFLITAGLDALRPYTGGDDGLLVVFEGTFLGKTQADLLDPVVMWPLVWIVTVVLVAVCALVVRSRFGAVLRGIRQNEERMRYSGFEPFWPKLIAFVFSAGIAAVAGLLFALSAGMVSTDIFGFGLSGHALVAALIGGVASVVGPIAGGLVYAYGQSALASSGNLQLFTGLGLVLFVVFLPGGLLPSLTAAGRKVYGRLTRRGGDHR